MVVHSLLVRTIAPILSREQTMNRCIIAFFCLGLTFVGCSPSATDLAESAGAPQAELTPAKDTAESESVQLTLADYDSIIDFVGKHAGKVVVVDLWSTSCTPCMEEFPNLVALSKSHSDDVACISVNLDYIGLKRKSAESYRQRVEEFLRSQSSTLTNFLASESDEAIRDKFEISSIPAIVVFDQTGKLVARLSEATSGEEGLSYEAHVIPLVDQLLAASAGD